MADSMGTSSGLFRPELSVNMAISRQEDLLRIISAFAEGSMSLDSLMGTIVELIDESVNVGVKIANNSGRLHHYAVGYIHGLTDRDNFLPPLEGV